MKKHSSVFVLILIIALAVSAFSIVSSAYKVTAESYAEVLEFYESYEYVNETFDSTALGEAFADSSAEFFQNGSFVSESISDGVYSVGNRSRVALTVSPRAKDLRSFDSFGYNFAFAFPDATGKITLEIRDTQGNQIPLLGFQGAAVSNQIDKVEFNSENPLANDAFFKLKTDDEYALSANAYYDVMIFVTMVSDTETSIVVNVSDRADTPRVKTYTTAVSNFNFDSLSVVHNASTATRAAKLDYVEAYEGSFSHRLNDIEAAVGEYINALYEAHRNNPYSDFEEDILKVVGKLVLDYGYTTTENTVLDSIEYCVKNLADKYALDYIDLASELTENSTYNERLELLADSRVLYRVIEYVNATYSNSDNNGDGDNNVQHDYILYAEDIAAAKKKFDKEAVDLPLLKENTVSFINIVKDKEVYSMNFVDLKEIYDKISVIETCPSFYDEEYSEKEVAAAHLIGRAVTEEFERLDANAKKFVEAVNILRDPYNNTFGKRYLAYVDATENYFTDESYDAFLEDITISELIRQYAIFAPGMSATSEYAEEFLMKLRSASETDNFTIKVKSLDAIDEAKYIDNVEKGYPGVAEAIKNYGDMRKYISDKIVSCREFIKAVQAIDGTTTLAAKKTAVAAALALADEGRDNTVVELVEGSYVNVSYNGWKVTDAAVKLAEADSAIKALENKAQNFVNAVEAIASAKTTADRRAAISYAISLKALADLTIDNAKQAADKLDRAILSFDADVTSANSFQNATGEFSVAVSSLAKGDIDSAKVVAIIKKFYD